MILGNQIEWVLHCMTVLSSLPEGEQVSSKDLAEYHGVPKDYLAKCLQQLSQAELVITTSGPKGGYRLSRKPDAISFLDIVEAVEGKKRTFQCQEIRGNNPCLSKAEKKFSSVCEIAAVMYEADESWRRVLREKKLSHIAQALSKKLTPEISEAIQEWFKK